MGLVGKGLGFGLGEQGEMLKGKKEVSLEKVKFACCLLLVRRNFFI